MASIALEVAPLCYAEWGCLKHVLTTAVDDKGDPRILDVFLDAVARAWVFLLPLPKPASRQGSLSFVSAGTLYAESFDSPVKLGRPGRQVAK